MAYTYWKGSCVAVQGYLCREAFRLLTTSLDLLTPHPIFGVDEIEGFSIQSGLAFVETLGNQSAGAHELEGHVINILVQHLVTQLDLSLIHI